MRQIICDSCKTGEELKGEAKAGREIKQVELKIALDERESVPRVPINADLCEKCRTEMLNQYFRQTIDNSEALLPESLKAGYVPVDEEEVHAASLSE
jgi:hypothetical protein